MVAEHRVLSDTQLVRESVAGDSRAFDALVCRHRQALLLAVRRLTENWEQAEDVAQQALLEAYRHLRSLREGEKFFAWVLTIARRCAANARADAPPPTIELSDSVHIPCYYPEPLTPADSLVEHIHDGLAALSARHRQVITLHYLDGYTCQEIAAQLGLAAGSVKRILHESRNRLRSGLTPLRRGGVMPMSTDHSGPKELTYLFSGQNFGKIYQLLQARLVKSCCLTVNKTAKSAEEIGRLVDANPAYVEEALAPLVTQEVISKLSGDRYRANFIALSGDDWIVLSRGIAQQGVVLADRLIPFLPQLEQAWNATSLPARGFPWEASIWPVLTLLVANNYGIHRYTAHMPAPPLHADGSRLWVGAHEVTANTPVLWDLGGGWSDPAVLDIGYGYFWTNELNRVEPEMGTDIARVAAALAEGAQSIEEIAEFTHVSLEKTRELVARAIEMGLVAREDDTLHPTFPVLRVSDRKALFDTVFAVAKPLAEEVVLPATAHTTELLQQTGYGHLSAQFPVWQAWMPVYVNGEGIRELLRRGILPPIPGDPAPANFALLGRSGGQGWWDLREVKEGNAR